MVYYNHRVEIIRVMKKGEQRPMLDFIKDMVSLITSIISLATAIIMYKLTKK